MTMSVALKRFWILFLAVALLLPRLALASALTSVSDIMASQTVSAVSNHQIAFVTPTGAAESSTITLSFSTSFDTSLITEDDVDVEVGGTDRTTAATCSGTEQLSVVMASDVLTITVCAGDGGAIAASGSVVVKIGTNATDSGTGSNRIINPSSAGTYTISIAGTFGDVGSIGMPIITTSSGTLTAVVPNTSSGGGGGGGSSSSTTTTTTGTTETGTTETGTTETGTTETGTTETGITETGTTETGTTETGTTETGTTETGATDTGTSTTGEAPTGSEGISAGSEETGGTSSGSSPEGAIAEEIPVAIAETPSTLESPETTTETSTTYLVEGYVYESEEDIEVPVSGAQVTLYESEYGEWVEIEKTTTQSDGTFSWSVAEGIYRVGITKDGYQETLSDVFTASEKTEVQALELEPLPTPIGEIIASEGTVGAKVRAIIFSFTESVSILLDEVRNTPQVQTAAEVTAPAVVTLTIVSGVILWNVFNLAPLLQYIFTSPVLLLGRKKRQGWGVVYHAGTKLPVDLAIVRLYSFPANRLMATRVTDKLGRYFFLAQPGEYRLTVLKPSFQFPSQLSAGLKEDGPYLDIYQGQTIQVSDRDVTIAANIPLDPTGTLQTDTFTKWHRLKLVRRLQIGLSALGLVGALFILLMQPGWLTVSGLVVQVILYGLFRRLAKSRKPKNWGIVYDDATHHPLSNAIVRIFEPKYNKLLETVMTDSHGRYNFLVGPNEYYTTYDREAYLPTQVRPLDFRGQKEAKEVAIDVGMKKKQEV